MELRRYVVKFAFEGHLFTGYARQVEGGTVEDELIGALVSAELIEGAKEGNFASASRVDRGVSAVSAAAAFDTPAAMDRVAAVKSRMGRVSVLAKKMPSKMATTMAPSALKTMARLISFRNRFSGDSGGGRID